MLICDSVGLAVLFKLCVLTVYLCGGFISFILSEVWLLTALCVSIIVCQCTVICDRYTFSYWDYAQTISVLIFMHSVFVRRLLQVVLVGLEVEYCILLLGIS